MLTLSGVSLAGVPELVFQGLDLLATPLGSPVFTTSDGTRVNGQRSGRVRVVPNVLGNGYRLEFNRSFGVDSQGRPEVFDAGPVELQLSGSVSSTLGFTRRGLMTGNAQFNTNNLDYSFRLKSGGQDAVLSGTLNGTQNVEINQFGFYTAQINLSNADSTLTLDGAVVDGTRDSNFDLGPINVRGNVFVDTFVALLASFGVDTSGLEQLIPGSPAGQIADAIREQLQRTAVAGITISQPSLPISALPMTDSAASHVMPPTIEPGNPGLTTIPEPATGALLLLGVAAFVSRRR